MTGSNDAASSRALEDESAEIRTFLIADVRGYTVFTQERGDEAAAKLARRFAAIAREAVEVVRDRSIVVCLGVVLPPCNRHMDR